MTTTAVTKKNIDYKFSIFVISNEAHGASRFIHLFIYLFFISSACEIKFVICPGIDRFLAFHRNDKQMSRRKGNNRKKTYSIWIFYLFIFFFSITVPNASARLEHSGQNNIISMKNR